LKKRYKNQNPIKNPENPQKKVTKIYLERQPQTKMGTLPIRASLARAEELDADLMADQDQEQQKHLTKDEKQLKASEDDDEEDEDEELDDDDQQPLNNETTATLSSASCGSSSQDVHVDLQEAMEKPKLEKEKCRKICTGSKSQSDTESDDDEDDDGKVAKDGAVADEDGWWY